MSSGKSMPSVFKFIIIIFGLFSIYFVITSFTPKPSYDDFEIVNKILDYEQFIYSEKELTIISNYNLTIYVFNWGSEDYVTVRVQLLNVHTKNSGPIKQKSELLQSHKIHSFNFVFHDREQKYMRRFRVWIYPRNKEFALPKPTILYF
jgi:hypothetical protein